MRFGSVVGVGPLTDDEKARNREYALGLGLPDAALVSKSGPLALVGGGPSIHERVEELRAWPGSIWAINGAMGWCRKRGIEATYISIDPEPSDVEAVRKGERVMLGLHCPSALYDALIERGAEVSTIDVDEVPMCSTTASAAIAIAVMMGHFPVTLFGCESSYTHLTHAYRVLDHGKPAEPVKHLINVACNGAEFLTKPEFLFQAEYLAKVLRQWPNLYRERSGGLLAAMVADPEYDITAGSKALHEALA